MIHQTRNRRGRTGRLLAILLAGAVLSAIGGALTAGPAAAGEWDPVFSGNTAPPSAHLGQDYFFVFTVGPAGFATCSVTDGALPDGLTFNSAQCAISGVATTLGSATFTVTASDAFGPDASVDVTLTVDQPPGLSSFDVPAAVVGQPYSYQLPLTGMPTPTVTEVGPDYLPAGLTLDPDGLIHGTPTQNAALFGWGLRLDSSAGTVGVGLHVTVNGIAPVITSAAPPDIPSGQPYSFTFTASGTPAPALLLTGTVLPDGLTFDENTGTLAGTTTALGTTSITFEGINVYGTAQQSYTLQVVGTAPVVSGTPPPATAGSPYTFTFQAPGASPPPSYRLASGSLPLGLSLFDDGTIAGTPTRSTDGTPVTVTASNGVAPDAVITFTLKVLPSAPAISGTPPTGVTRYLSYSFQYTLSGSPAPTTQVSDGTPPPGLTLDDAGYLSGFPSSPGTYTFTVRASNSTSPDAFVTSTIVVAGVTPPAPPSVTISGTPPEAGVAEPYSYTFTSTGGPRVSRSAGSLPPGLSLSSSGRLTGTPTRAGTYSFTVQAAGGSATPSTLPVTLVVRPAPTVSVSCVAVTEGNSGTHPLTVTVTLSRASTVPVSVKWSTANGTAVAGSDYTAASGTVTFTPGQTSKTVTVQVRGDRTHERDEYFLVRLASPSHATIDRGSAVATVRNDD